MPCRKSVAKGSQYWPPPQLLIPYLDKHTHTESIESSSFTLLWGACRKVYYPGDTDTFHPHPTSPTSPRQWLTIYLFKKQIISLGTKRKRGRERKSGRGPQRKVWVECTTKKKLLGGFRPMPTEPQQYHRFCEFKLYVCQYQFMSTYERKVFHSRCGLHSHQIPHQPIIKLTFCVVFVGLGAIELESLRCVKVKATKSTLKTQLECSWLQLYYTHHQQQQNVDGVKVRHHHV